MDEAKAAPIRRWIVESQQDAESANRVLEWDPPRLGTAAYHFGQAAEKTLKAFLTCHGVAFRTSADLQELVRAAIPLAPAFKGWSAAVRALRPYRRPAPFAADAPPAELPTAQAAVDHARVLYRFACDMLQTSQAHTGIPCPPSG